jgi:hypothetical protein
MGAAVFATVKTWNGALSSEPCPREDFEGAGEVEDLDVVEDQDADVPLVHVTLLGARRRGAEPDPTPLVDFTQGRECEMHLPPVLTSVGMLA